MTILIWIIVAVVVLCLLWAAINYVPEPSGFPLGLRNLLRLLLLVVAAVILYLKFLA